MRHVSDGLAELTARSYELVAAGDLAQARTELEDGLAATEFDGSTVPPELAEAASLYARLLLTGGQVEEAREWAVYAHGAAERLYGAADPRTVREAATLAAALSRLGELPAAERLYREVVSRLAGQEGPGAPRVLAARADLATVLHATGECRAARSELAGALAAHQAGYGVQEPAGIRMLARLAAMSRDCGDEEAARRHFTRAAALAEAYLPADHPVAAQVAALAAAPADAAHPCEESPAGAPGPVAHGAPAHPPVDPPAMAAMDADWWPPEQDAAPPAEHVASRGDEERHRSGEPERAEPPAPGAGGHAITPGAPLPRTDGAPLPLPALASRPVSRGHLAAPRRMPIPGQVPFHEPAPPPAPQPAPQPAPHSAPQPAQQPAGAPAHHLPAYAEMPPPDGAPDRPRWATAALAAGLAVLGVAGGWFAATRLVDGGDGSVPPAAPAAATSAPASPAVAAAPAEVTLRDTYDSVTLSWRYPGGAEGPVLVAGGRTGEQQRAFQTLAPGTTSYTVYGLAERADYCFTVAVVYSADSVARSAPVCTARTPRSPG
jgi:hypothetical protein